MITVRLRLVMVRYVKPSYIAQHCSCKFYLAFVLQLQSCRIVCLTAAGMCSTDNYSSYFVLCRFTLRHISA